MCLDGLLILLLVAGGDRYGQGVSVKLRAEPPPVHQVCVVIWVSCLYVAVLRGGMHCLPGYMYKSKRGTHKIWKTSKQREGSWTCSSLASAVFSSWVAGVL